MNLIAVSGGGRLLFFYESLRLSDLHIVERQMAARKFDPAPVLGTADRCRFGCPRVVVSSPLSAEAVPFPTSFWLTCPWLRHLIGTIESGGGVSELERWLESREKIRVRSEWLLFDTDYRLARMSLLPPSRLDYLRCFKPKIFDRLFRDGIGGTRYQPESPIRVKCIHLQTASWLAFRRHPAEEWLRSRGVGQDCGGAMRELCSAHRIQT